MGLTFVHIRASKDAQGAPTSIRVLVDTGATYTMLPRRTLTALGVVPNGRVRVRLGDGREVPRDLGIVWVRYRTYATWTWALLGERGDARVLGALTLEELRLQVDPRSRRLREVKVALMVPAAAA